jgi:ABC-type Mn2+/Zn2+ transport system ATPase subunit
MIHYEKSVIKIDNLIAGYGGKKVLNGLNFQVVQGESVGIIGPNGSGKTTLFKAILGLLKPLRGEIIVLGHRLLNEKERRWARGQIGYVPQQSVPGKLPITVHDAVLMGRWGKNFCGLKRPGPQERKVTSEVVAWVGLAHKEWSDCRYLSGGEQQKVAIARALVREADILLLDEPTAFLDQRSRNELLALLKRIRAEQGLTLVIISHDFWQVKDLTDQTWQLAEGNLRPISLENSGSSLRK